MSSRGNVIRRRKLPLWTPKWSKENLIQQRNSVTAREFDRGFRQRPFSEEDRLFALDSIARVTNKGLSVKEVKEMNGEHFTGVDLSSTKRPGVAFFTFKAVLDGGEYVRIPVDIRVGEFKGKSLMRQFVDIEKEFKPQVFTVENNALQERIIDLIDVGTKKTLPLWGYYTGKQKMDETQGLPSLALEFENDMWIIPWQGRGREDNPPDGHGILCDCGWCTWYYDEIQVYPMSESTDLLMAMWFAREGFREFGQSFEHFEIIENPTEQGRFNW